MKMRRTIPWVLAAILVGGLAGSAAAGTYQANWYDNQGAPGTAGAQCGTFSIFGSLMQTTVSMTGTCAPFTGSTSPLTLLQLCGIEAVSGNGKPIAILIDVNGNKKIDGTEGIKTIALPSTPGDYFSNFGLYDYVAELVNAAGDCSSTYLEYSTGLRK